jgi:hypothetical protein
MIEDYESFRKAMSNFHLSQPKLDIHFKDNFSDRLRSKWYKMDRAILQVIWEIYKEIEAKQRRGK